MTDASRPNPFAKLDRFKPKEDNDNASISGDIDSIASASKWPSREPVATQPNPIKRPYGVSGEPPKVQFNIRVDEQDKDRFYRIAEKKGIRKLGELFKQCLDAIERNDS